MASISLTASVRSNVISLKATSAQLETTTERLATGKKVSSAIDNPTNYFAAQNYNDRADALSSRLDGMSEATEQINAADNGITNIKSFLSQMKGVVNDALSNTDSEERRALGEQFNELIVQVRDMAQDSSYGGINLLYDNASTTVQFGENIGDSTLKLEGFNISAATGEADANGELSASAITGGAATSYALTIDIGGSDVVGIKAAGSHSAAPPGASDFVSAATAATTTATAYNTNASANNAARTTASNTIETQIEAAVASANELEGSSVYAWTGSAVTGSGSGTYASAMETVFDDLATLYSAVGASTPGTESSDVTDAVDAINGKTGAANGSIADIEALRTPEVMEARYLYISYGTISSRSNSLQKLASDYNNYSNYYQTKDEVLTSAANNINGAISDANTAEGSSTFSWDSSTGVISGTGSMPLSGDALAVIQDMADVYSAIEDSTGSGSDDPAISTAVSILSGTRTTLNNDNAFLYGAANTVYSNLDTLTNISTNAVNDTEGTKAFVLTYKDSNMDYLVYAASALEEAQGGVSSAYSWDDTTDTLSGIGTGTSPNASKYEALLQNVLTLYNAVEASSSMTDTAVVDALAVLTAPTTPSVTGSLSTFSTLSGGTSTGTDAHEIDWGGDTYQDDLSDVIGQIEDVEGTLKTQSSKLANNLAIITQREDFTTKAINILEEGADNLTLADMNEEGANLLALQTAQSLGVQSLSLASQQASNVLQLIQ